MLRFHPPSSAMNCDLETLWFDHVHSRFMYRGTNGASLRFPLDPLDTPYATLAGPCLEVLKALQAHPFDFDIVERHFGRTYRTPIADVLTWTRRDLRDRRIDFTSSWEAAREYSDNHLGSQIYQNIKSIYETLRERGLLAALDGATSRKLAGLYDRVIHLDLEHAPVILVARRSCRIFNGNPSPILGDYGSFASRFAALPGGEDERVAAWLKALRDPFDVIVRERIQASDIQEIIGPEAAPPSLPCRPT